MKHVILRAALAIAFILVPRTWAQECEGSEALQTNHFYFSASFDQGAKGDAVAIEVSLTLDDLHPIIDGQSERVIGFAIAGCYPREELEIVDTAQYSDFFDRFAFLSYYFPHPIPEREDNTGVFLLGGNLRAPAIDEFFSPGKPFSLVTVYFRIKGTPGATSSVRFCDYVIAGRSCGVNYLLYEAPARHSGNVAATSSRHVDGLIRILEGEPTHPDPPSLPPNAKVYPQAPTPEMADILFELEGPVVTHPGASDVPFDLFVTSNFEFSGFMTSVVFPAAYLELTHVDEHTRPGVLAIDNQAGTFGILMSNSRRRVGAEGERVRLATLHFAVKEAARETTSLSVSFAPAGNYFNWLAVQYREGVNPDELPTTSEVTPLVLADALLGVQTRPTPVGDVNLDYEVSISDPIALLGYLFQGSRIACLPAADFNEDRRVDISDAIAILSSLFLGGTAPVEEVNCG